MKITTWNVNGIRARKGQVAEWLHREKPDVLCLQEIKATPQQIPSQLALHDGYWSFWHGGGGYSGVALLVSKQLSPTRPRFTHPEFDHENRIVIAELDALRVASIYVPNGGKDFAAKVRFLEAMERFTHASISAGLDLVLCGDLNVARTPRDVHEKLRDPHQYGQTDGERALLEATLAHGLTDLGRHFAPDDDALFTWWAPWRQYRERNIGWRLDYVLTTAKVTHVAQRCVALRDFGTSDHGPVTAFIEGQLFDPSRVVAGESAPPPTPSPPKRPQLDLFG